MFKQLAQGLRAHLEPAPWSFAIVVIASGGVPVAYTHGHVLLDSPNGGETLVGGEVITIEWHVDVMHNTLDWDLWYSTESNEGPWLELATDLPKGNIDPGAVHTFDWTVPEINAPSSWVRVQQDNAGEDYIDVNDASFSIASPLGGADFTGNGSVDAADLSAWEQGFGTASGADPADGDADLDTDVDGADFLAWQSELTGTAVSLSATAHPVPEPAATALLLMGMLFFLWPRRTYLP